MDSLIRHNDAIVRSDEACLYPGQAGLLIGWGVFTTLRIYRGLPFAFDRHWARMSRDATKLGVEFGRTQLDVRQAVIDLARANHREEGMARVAFVRNRGGAWTGDNPSGVTDLLILTRELPQWPETHRLEIGPRAIFSESPFSGLKCLAWAVPSLLAEQAHSRGFDDTLILNERGQLAECTSANFFLVRGGTVLTPPLSSGCLPGVTRETLLEIAPRNGIPFREVELTIDDLSEADEVFISSTTREVAPVSLIAPARTFFAPGKMSQALESVFRAHVHSWLQAQ